MNDAVKEQSAKQLNHSPSDLSSYDYLPILEIHQILQSFTLPTKKQQQLNTSGMTNKNHIFIKY